MEHSFQLVRRPHAFAFDVCDDLATDQEITRRAVRVDLLDAETGILPRDSVSSQLFGGYLFDGDAESLVEHRFVSPRRLFAPRHLDRAGGFFRFAQCDRYRVTYAAPPGHSYPNSVARLPEADVLL